MSAWPPALACYPALAASRLYARADHSHGTPALPGLGGDAGGNPQQQPDPGAAGLLKADNPTDGQLFILIAADKRGWVDPAREGDCR